MSQITSESGKSASRPGSEPLFTLCVRNAFTLEVQHMPAWLRRWTTWAATTIGTAALIWLSRR